MSIRKILYLRWRYAVELFRLAKRGADTFRPDFHEHDAVLKTQYPREYRHVEAKRRLACRLEGRKWKP